uniref:Hypothetical conserved protein n=2 Tax=Candidatus Bipolaricaulota TaxID=67810 RepID=H5SNF8_9BACT|nr:hypothetical conserved protein [uncultured Acetothermia bacterium]BAL59378.1 hypothetical conserved protein [Candidatus Acetothermum autotrophicum]
MAAIPQKPLEELIRELPPQLRQQVQDFVEFLLEKHKKPSEQPAQLTFSWYGALKQYRDQFTSVELQHKILEWWVEEIQNELSGR